MIAFRPAVLYRKIAWIRTPEGKRLLLEPMDNSSLVASRLSIWWPPLVVWLN